MSRMNIGSRVRIVRAVCFPFLVGCEAVIVGRGVTNEWRLDISGHGRTSPRGFPWSCNSDAIEPIVPNGAAASGFANLRDLLDSLERVRA